MPCIAAQHGVGGGVERGRSGAWYGTQRAVPSVGPIEGNTAHALVHPLAEVRCTIVGFEMQTADEEGKKDHHDNNGANDRGRLARSCETAAGVKDTHDVLLRSIRVVGGTHCVGSDRLPRCGSDVLRHKSGTVGVARVPRLILVGYEGVVQRRIAGHVRVTDPPAGLKLNGCPPLVRGKAAPAVNRQELALGLGGVEVHVQLRRLVPAQGVPCDDGWVGCVDKRCGGGALVPMR